MAYLQPISLGRGAGAWKSRSGARRATRHRACANTFVAEIAAAEEREFPSVGHGTDHRYKRKGLAGTALVHENEVIHAAFFRLDEAEQPEHMASYRARRRPFA